MCSRPALRKLRCAQTACDPHDSATFQGCRGRTPCFRRRQSADALREIAAGFEKESGLHATLNFGGSSLLARQIEKGASADVFVSADEAKLDHLQKNGLVVVATDSVRAALAAVNADFAFVYKTEASISKRVRVIYAVPEKETPKIRYPVAILGETKRRAAAERFVRYSVLPTRSTSSRATASLCSADVARAR